MTKKLLKILKVAKKLPSRIQKGLSVGKEWESLQWSPIKILAWNQAPHWRKRRKKSASEGSREVVVQGSSPLVLGSLRSRIFLFDPLFRLFRPLWSFTRTWPSRRVSYVSVVHSRSKILQLRAKTRLLKEKNWRGPSCLDGSLHKLSRIYSGSIIFPLIQLRRVASKSLRSCF